MKIRLLTCFVCASSAAVAQTATGGFVPLVNIPGTAAKLPEMKGIAVDAAGNVFFAAGGNFSYSVLRWDAGTGLLTTVAGNGTPGFSGDGGPATSAQLDGVTGIALDGAGNLYIADSNNGRVRKVSNGIINTVAGGGSSRYFFCNNCPASSVNLSYLTGVAANSAGDLYIFNPAFANKPFVFKLSNGALTATLNISSVAGYAPLTTAAVDSNGSLYITDTFSNRVLKVLDGVVTTVAGTGTLGFSGDNGPATSAQLAGPRGVALDAAGNLYIADTGNQRIRKLSNGIITTIAGGGSPTGGLGDNGPATGGLLNYPFGVGVDSAGNIYIQDTLDRRIRKVGNETITTVAGGGPTPVLLARSAGTLSTTVSMNTGPNAYTATLLNNGKVLVAGGSSYKDEASAKLYDPSTGTFSPTGSMTAGFGLIATLLPDGKVLIVGSVGSPNATAVPASTQLYDPSTGTFTAGASSRSIFRPLTATLLNNGRVLVTGDLGSDYNAELYDPSTGQFTSAGKMSRSHVIPNATLLPNGTVLLSDNSCAAISTDLQGNELYDPVTGTFNPIAETESCLLIGPQAVLLANGQVSIGGTLYDPPSGTFTHSSLYDTVTAVTPGPEVAQWGTALALLTDGTVFIAGGEPLFDYNYCSDCEADSIPDVYLRDPVTGTLGLAGFMSVPRYYAHATYLPDGTVLISGGASTNANDPRLLTVEIYRPSVLTASPQLFSVWHASGKPVSADNPAAAGEVLSMYTTSLIEGGAIPPRVIVGGRLAEIVYFGDAPGYAGYFQVNFRVPEGVTASVVPVRLRYLDRPSNEVTIQVQ